MMCVCVQQCTCANMLSGAYICAYVWRSEVNLSCHCLSATYHLFLRKDLSLSYTLPRRLGCVCHEPQQSFFSVPTPVLRLQICHHAQMSCGFFGSNLGPCAYRNTLLRGISFEM